jgi:GDP-L-fucose synthase
MKEKHILTGPVEPTNGGYAMAKLVGMEAARYAGYVSMIPCNLYGPKDNFSEGGHVLAALVRKVCDAQKDDKSSITVWGDGTARREFLHVDDCADAIVAATQLDGPYINIGSGEDITIHDLARLIAEVAGWNGDIVFDTSKPNGMMRKLLDTSLLDSIGWKQKISLTAGISQMISDYRSM